MSAKEFKALFISDFNIENCCAYLTNDKSQPKIIAEAAPYGQVMSILLDKNASFKRKKYDFMVIWTQPEEIIKSFQQALNNVSPNFDAILKEVDEFSAAIIELQKYAPFIIVPSWICHPRYNIDGVLNMNHKTGTANILMHMNLRLAQNLSTAKNIYIVNPQKWVVHAGEKLFSPKLWYLAKVPFDNIFFKAAANDIKASVRKVVGDVRKLIILDLDDTLWGGIVGDLGWENIILGGHDHVGEAFVDFQLSLKTLSRRGILLGIVSKNEKKVALEAIKNHPEMILKVDDFVGWRINWQDKAQNIVDLVSELNLGLQSVVFIDDNPAERARVRESLPEVLVPEWPLDKTLYSISLSELNCFNTTTISHEDIKRTEMYKTEQKRKDSQKNIGSVEEWLKSLKVCLKIEEINKTNSARTVQLFNKTNQMNLSTRRHTEAELLNWLKQADRKLWTIRVSDKFGDSGLTGILSINVDNNKAQIIDLILSCRVFGRKIEYAMLHKAINYSQKRELSQVYAEYIPTPKNKPCLDFLNSSGFKSNKNIFTYDCTENFPLPDFITIEDET